MENRFGVRARVRKPLADLPTDRTDRIRPVQIDAIAASAATENTQKAGSPEAGPGRNAAFGTTLPTGHGHGGRHMATVPAGLSGCPRKLSPRIVPTDQLTG